MRQMEVEERERDESECIMPLDFFTSGSGSASLINWPSSFTFPNVIFLSGQEEKRRMKTADRANGTKLGLGHTGSI